MPEGSKPDVKPDIKQVNTPESKPDSKFAKKPGKRSVSPSRQARRTLATDTLDQLQVDFPRCFLKPPKAKPLAVGTAKKLHDHYKAADNKKMGLKAIKAALQFYASRDVYFEAVLKQRFRVDLRGLTTAEITTEERQHAREIMEIRLARRAEIEATQKPEKPSFSYPKKASWKRDASSPVAKTTIITKKRRIVRPSAAAPKDPSKEVETT